MVKKLNSTSVEKTLLDRQMIIFTPAEFSRLFQTSSPATIKFIHHYSQKELFIKLRNGLYLLKRKQPSLFVVANKIYQPSYVSLETALSFYNIIPETIYSLTSVTTKATREFTALGQSFTYTRIKKNVFQGYYLHKQASDQFLIAEPAKAMVDYLYLVSLRQKDLNERLNLTGLNKKQIKYWVKIFAYPPLTKLAQQIL